MMPPEQETAINAPNSISPNTNRTENISINGEQEGSSSNKVKPSLDIDHNSINIPSHPPTPITSFSILPQSLRPITIKVSILANLSLLNNRCI
jgi:hypothetical protein